MVAMDKTITEYYTASHAKPLVFVPRMGLVYFNDGSKGHQTSSVFSGQIDLMLDYVIGKGGDFGVRYPSFPQTAMHISLTDANGFYFVGVTLWDVAWTKWWESFVKMQRRLNNLLWKRHRPPLKLIRAFLETDMAETIPSEIMSKVVHAYFEPAPRLPCSNTATRAPVRIVETNSFKLHKLNL